jgi:hypothetical protein
MFFNNISIYSIPFIGILLIILLGLSNPRGMLTYQLHAKRKRRHSQNSFATIPITPVVKYIPNLTRIPLEDDEELMKSEIASKFCTIELRVEQDLDSDNDEK